jgi:hypothetical protein
LLATAEVVEAAVAVPPSAAVAAAPAPALTSPAAAAPLSAAVPAAGPRPRGAWVWIDEVQKVPAVLDEVHRLM